MKKGVEGRMDKKNEGDRHPPRVRSPLTFQLWLLLYALSVSISVTLLLPPFDKRLSHSDQIPVCAVYFLLRAIRRLTVA